MVEIKKVECPSDKVKIKCPYAMTPTRIVIHNTANDAPAENEIAYMLSQMWNFLWVQKLKYLEVSINEDL